MLIRTSEKLVVRDLNDSANEGTAVLDDRLNVLTLGVDRAVAGCDSQGFDEIISSDHLAPAALTHGTVLRINAVQRTPVAS